MSVKWRQNTYGMDLLVDTGGLNLTSNTGLKLHIKKRADGTTVTKTNPDVTDNGAPSAGVLKYVIATGDLNVTGVYEVVAEVDFTGKVYKSSTGATFEVVGDFDV